MTISITNNTENPAVVLELPQDLDWLDEYWSPTVGVKEFSLKGKIHLQQSEVITGRPITITSPDPNRGWFKKSLVDALYDLAAVKDLELTLLLNDGVSRTVQFDHTTNPVSFQQLWFVDEPTDEHVYNGTLVFLETA